MLGPTRLEKQKVKVMEEIKNSFFKVNYIVLLTIWFVVKSGNAIEAMRRE